MLTGGVCTSSDGGLRRIPIGTVPKQGDVRRCLLVVRLDVAGHHRCPLRRAQIPAKLSFRFVFVQHPHVIPTAFRAFVRAAVPSDCDVASSTTAPAV
jgi:hypothetical protein